MNIQPSSPNLYRLNFQQILLERARLRASNILPEQQPLFADVYVSGKPSQAVPVPEEIDEVKPAIINTPPNLRAEEATQAVSPKTAPIAPQDIDEMKHAATNVPPAVELEETTRSVHELKQRSDQWYTDSSLKFNPDSYLFKPPLTVRQKMEQEVRICKKSGLVCPYADRNLLCSVLFIRCGERAQFGTPELLEQRNMPHSCMYRPDKAGKYILVVDSNRAICEFCKNSIELFLHYDRNYIAVANNGFEAIEVLKRFKVEGKVCGLVITDTNLPGMNGFEVVNELFERNYNAGVVLTKEQGQGFAQPGDFKGLQEIIPRKTLVEKIISKPFHSAAFITALKSLDIRHLFE